MIRAAAAIRRYGLLVLGAVGIVVGAVLLSRAAPMPSGFSAYVPLSNTTYVPPFITGSLVLGGVLLGIGIALAAGWIGFAIGVAVARRRRAVPPSQ